jgi:hypothetical protein
VDASAALFCTQPNRKDAAITSVSDNRNAAQERDVWNMSAGGLDFKRARDRLVLRTIGIE